MPYLIHKKNLTLNIFPFIRFNITVYNCTCTLTSFFASSIHNMLMQNIQLGLKKKNLTSYSLKVSLEIPLSESVCGQRTHELVINVMEQQLSPIIHFGLLLLFLSPQQGHHLIHVNMHAFSGPISFFSSRPSQTSQYTQLTGTHWDVVLTWSIACSNFLIVSSISLFTIFKSK